MLSAAWRGPLFATGFGMHNTTTIDRRGSTSFVRVIRGAAAASLVVLGFGLAILLIGTPIALVVRALYEGLLWLAGAPGSISNVAAAFVLIAAVLILLVTFFGRRRRGRARVSWPTRRRPKNRSQRAPMTNDSRWPRLVVHAFASLRRTTSSEPCVIRLGIC